MLSKASEAQVCTYSPPSFLSFFLCLSFLSLLSAPVQRAYPSYYYDPLTLYATAASAPPPSHFFPNSSRPTGFLPHPSPILFEPPLSPGLPRQAAVIQNPLPLSNFSSSPSPSSAVSSLYPQIDRGLPHAQMSLSPALSSTNLIFRYQVGQQTGQVSFLCLSPSFFHLHLS